MPLPFYNLCYLRFWAEAAICGRVIEKTVSDLEFLYKYNQMRTLKTVQIVDIMQL